MNNYDFVFTEDKSVGLYNNDVKDIYHSKSGAYKEAVEKFVLPAIKKDFILNKSELKVLDICYGIGYNTKALLHYDYNNSITIDALEYDENLIQLSPFIKDEINNDELKIFVIYHLYKNNLVSNNLLNIIQNIDKMFFDSNICNYFEFLLNLGYKYNPQDDFNSFLHNIYYNYISKGINKALKSSKYNKSCINYYIDDARKSILKLDNEHDIVFLDAFSSQKDPTLWTIDFLSQVKDKMNTNSILVSYSKSTPFRSALIELGFYVGKTFIDNIDMGTVASLNKNNISIPLSAYDLELISTRSGITYKDKDLNLSSNEILTNREKESSNSSRISHTQFIKSHNKNYNIIVISREDIKYKQIN